MAPWALKTLITATQAPNLTLPTTTASTVAVEPTVTRDEGTATPTAPVAIDRSEGTDELAAVLMKLTGLNEEMRRARLLCTCAVGCADDEHDPRCPVGRVGAPSSVFIISDNSDDGSPEEVSAALTEIAALDAVPRCTSHDAPQPCFQCLA
jgi:hypothetical protein